MSRSRKPVNPNAEQALDRLKVETAAELGLQNYGNIYKGALTSADNGRVGGNMVRKMIQSQEQQFTGQTGQTGQTGFGKNQGQGQQGQQTLTTKYDVNSK